MNNTFGKDIIPSNEQERLKALRQYEVLDTPREGAFDHIAQMAVRMFNVPIALVSFTDQDRVWFKANIGMEDVTEADRGVSLCSLAILSDEPTVFLDATNERCLLANPLVVGDFGLRFCAGAPLRTAEGFNIGTLCVVDKKPRYFSPDDQRTLENLAKIVMDEIELRYLRKIVAKEKGALPTPEPEINHLSNIQ